MSKLAWITPATTPTSLGCFCIYAPDDELFLAALAGVLSEFELERNWEDVFGVVSAAQAVTWWQSANALNFPFNYCPSGGDMRIGTFFWWAGTGVPSGALVCDGGTYSPTAYPELFAAIGYTWGQDGTDFLLPDLREHGLIGAAFGMDVGDSVGNETVTLTEANLPEFTVPIRRDVATGANSYVLKLGTSDGSTVVQSMPVGSGQAFNIRNPDRIMLPCIEAYTP